ncbi:TetR/AcrR family transcriptional regulator [Mycolicibacterium arseniciresistens]|uniref:TetR/AcrR family transcriptional regulator n=1 Tax=Mycolicibacterium arseniciresistens TaxID=3062257 RepID=A0ABT8UDE0_9MYCO|nr:TetR/AcrR family transcriptional regulator [Mycolicibacterium arseniciresistens]MDO3634214.1 TetR/AcrR family transcriptional regulator [Mycolicibacterium arseniciresistens]
MTDQVAVNREALPAVPSKRGPRRERIVASALALAAEGYDAVHMRTVAEHAKVATDTVYQHFTSKDDLLVAALDRWLTTFEPASESGSQPVTDPSRQLSHVLDVLTRRLWGNPLCADAVMRAYLSSDNSAASYVDQVRDTLTRIFTSAISPRPASAERTEIAGLVADVWVSNMLALVQGRATTAEAGQRLLRIARALSRSDSGGDCFPPVRFP